LNFDDLDEELKLPERIAGLGLEYFHRKAFENHPLQWNPKIFIATQIAGATEISYRCIAQLVANNLRRISNGESPIDLIQTNASE
jgi:phosphoglycerate dehydrogenase-like enzyme